MNSSKNEYATKSEEQEAAKNSQLKLEWAKLWIGVLKSLIWPLAFLFFAILYWSPINTAINHLLENVTKASKFSVAGLSVEIQEQAKIHGDPDLVEKLSKLSAHSINELIQIRGAYSLFGNWRSTDYQVFAFPSEKRINAIKELLETGLFLSRNSATT